MCSITSASVHVESDEESFSGTHHNTGTSTSFIESSSTLDTSLRLHDYCLDLPSISFIRHQSIQTHVNIKSDACTQTDEVSSLTMNSTQTDFVRTNEIGIQVNLPVLTYEDIKTDDQKISFYTGIPDRITFDSLFEDIAIDAAEGTGRATGSAVGRPRSLKVIDEFFLVLMRLRLGLLLEDLAYRFCISSTACGKLVNQWIDYLDHKLSSLVIWTSREVIDANMPDVFKEKFPNTRVIIDCTEIHTETPHSLQLKSLLYSDYKSHMTWKSLIGINPSGIVTFVSDLWSGSISDKKITEESHLIDLCEAGDAIMADKGFTIADLTTPKGVTLIIPPFKRKKKQMPKRDVKKTKDIANARIHVEREMERIKNFRILQGVMPISMAKRASKVWKICVRLTNLQPPLVPMKRKIKPLK